LPPTPVEAGGTLIRLHAAPMHFYKKGKGRYKAAPPESLKAALAGAETFMSTLHNKKLSRHSNHFV
jgi:hypothetical protein